MITILLLVLVLIGNTGCDVLFDLGCIDQPDYVEVIVNADVCVSFSDGKTPPTSIMWSGAQIEIAIIKAGGERVQFDRYASSGGCTDSVQGIFNVYREQPVEVVARPIYGVIPDFAGGGFYDSGKYRVSNNVATLRWSDIYPAKDFGDTYVWQPTISILVQPN